MDQNVQGLEILSCRNDGDRNGQRSHLNVQYTGVFDTRKHHNLSRLSESAVLVVKGKSETEED